MGGRGRPSCGSDSMSTVTWLRRVGALIPASFRVGRGVPVPPGWLRCCAARRPAPALRADAAAPRCSSWLLPRSARWLLQTEFRRAAGGRDPPALLPLRWPAQAGRRGWRSLAQQESFPSPRPDTSQHFSVALRAPHGSLPLLQAYEVAGARPAWLRGRPASTTVLLP